MVLGVCGKACGGKNAVSEVFAQEGWLIIDADKLGQEALVAKEEEIIAAFAMDDIFNKAGGIDRKKLGKVVFSNKKKLKELNSISHPYIVDAIHQALALAEGRNVIINAALLPLVKVEGLDAILFVIAPLCTRITRARNRDKRNILFILKRIWAQRNLKPQLFWKNVDIYYISNNGTLDALEDEVASILTTIKGKEC